MLILVLTSDGCTGQKSGAEEPLWPYRLGAKRTGRMDPRHWAVAEETALRNHPYLLVIKHGWLENLMNGGFDRKIIDKWSIYHCHVSLPEGI